MRIEYIKSESTIKPELVDATSSKKVVYLRKNIEEITRENEDGSTATVYEYDEAKLTKEEYEKYLDELEIENIRQQRADIDYIALMTGIDLGEV